MTRYYYQEDVHGGKIHLGKTIKKISQKGNKYAGMAMDYTNPLSYALDKPILSEASHASNKFLKKKVLPVAVTVGMPIASTALGAVASAYGGPAAGMAAQQLSQSMMKQYIPSQYQSKNKYALMAGEMAGAMASQGFQDYASGIEGMEDFKMADTTSMTPMQQAMYQTMGNMATNYAQPPQRNYPKGSLPTSQYYNPENPYQDLMLQAMKSYNVRAPTVPTSSTPPTVNENAVSDAMYKSSNLGEGSDSLTITSSPFQQKEGSASALLGGGMKKRRGRPKKIVYEEEEIYVKHKPSYKKFSHSKNSSLEQLLEANREREEKENKSAMKSMVEKQTRALGALGYGIGRPAKGSQEMKDRMARIRAMKKK